MPSASAAASKTSPPRKPRAKPCAKPSLEADAVAEEAAAGPVGSLDPLASGRGLLLGQVAGRHRRVDRGQRRRLAGRDEPVAIGPELGGEACP